MAMIRLARATLTGALLMVALTGCGGASAPIATGSAAASIAIASPVGAASAAPTSTPAPTATPQPTVDVGASGVAYLAMSANLAKALTPIFDELAARSHKEAAYIKLNQEAADAYRTAIEELAAIEVPAGLEGDVAALSGVLDKLAKEFEHTVADPSYDNVKAVDALNIKLTEAAAAIRKALALPPPG
jgi:hypothetical protein